MPRGFRADGSPLGWGRGSGMPATGAGWGGAARGASASRYGPDNPPDQDAATEGRRQQVADDVALRALLAPHKARAAARLIEILDSPDAKPLEIAAVFDRIADRTEGKVTDKLEVSPLASVSDADLKAAIAYTRAALGRDASGDGSGVDEAPGPQPAGGV